MPVLPGGALPEEFESGDEHRHGGDDPGPLHPQGEVDIGAQGRDVGAQGGKAGVDVSAQGGEAVIGVVRRAVGADRAAHDSDDGFAALSADIDTGFAALRADIATLRADIYLALWVQGAGIVAAMAVLIAAFKLFG